MTRLTVVTPTVVDDEEFGAPPVGPIETLNPVRPANLARFAAPVAAGRRRGPRLTGFVWGLATLVFAVLTLVAVVLASFGIGVDEGTIFVWIGGVIVLSTATMILALATVASSPDADGSVTRRLVWMDEMNRATGAWPVAVTRDHQGRITRVYETPRAARILALLDEACDQAPGMRAD